MANFMTFPMTAKIQVSGNDIVIGTDRLGTAVTKVAQIACTPAGSSQAAKPLSRVSKPMPALAACRWAQWWPLMHYAAGRVMPEAAVGVARVLAGAVCERTAAT